MMRYIRFSYEEMETVSDVWYYISSFLNNKDYLSLKLTCKSFLFLESQGEIEIRKCNGDLLLLYKNGYIHGLRILKPGIDNIRIDDNCALKGSAMNGHLEVVKYLIELGLTLEDVRSENNAALRWSACNGHLEVVKYLIELGLTLDDASSDDNYVLSSR